jgi:trehalose 6-phosphate phosphatase
MVCVAALPGATRIPPIMTIPMPATDVLLPLPPALARDWALFLDVDGCLVEFTDDPADAGVPPGVVQRLLTLSGLLDGALALVSGRRIDTLDRMFAPALFPAAGLHGLERRLDDDIVVLPVPENDAIGAVHADALQALAPFPGALVEDKGLALALHWRAAPEAAASAQAFAEGALARLPGYRLQPGDHVIELRPDVADKGTAIEALLEHAPFRGRLPVFAGDDLTDEHGFEVVNARGGISILVGGREGSAARHGLADPAAVRHWLGVTE